MNTQKINSTEILQKTIPIIREAGDILLKYFDSSIRIRFKGQHNMVTEADLASEKFILNALTELTPDIPIMSEEDVESGHQQHWNAMPLLWVIDPLDGTTNYTHNLPHFCISIALVQNGTPLLGLVFDPCKTELFTAIKNRGAFLNERKIEVSNTSDLMHSLLATGFPYQVRDTCQNNLMEFCAMRLRSQGVRRIGAAALDLVYVAKGRLDGFWEQGLKPWDTAAGWLHVIEAGGSVTKFNGLPYSLFSSKIVATNHKIHAELIQILNRKLPELPLTLYD